MDDVSLELAPAIDVDDERISMGGKALARTADIRKQSDWKIQALYEIRSSRDAGRNVPALTCAAGVLRVGTAA